MIEGDLADLARRWGVQTGYWDVSGQWHDASVDTLVDVLAQLGAPISSPDDAPAAVAAHQRLLVAQPTEPVVVVEAGAPLAFEIRVPAAASGHVAVEVRSEDGLTRSDHVDLERVEPHTRWEIDGQTWAVRWLVTTIGLPTGYHHVTVEVGPHRSELQALVSPPRLPALDRPAWGVFAPTYGFIPAGEPGQHHLGIGHLGDLDDLARRLAPMGATIVSTLPLLATFLDQPFDPSPYSPVSRRWWSELHLDPARLPGLDESPTAQELLASRRFDAAAADLAARPLIDHAATARLVRELYDAVAADLAESSGPTASALARFAADRPELEVYARFRALVERLGDRWGSVKEQWRGREITTGDVDPGAVARHRYIQFAADAQLHQLSADFQARGQILALDLPLGSNPDGFDVWANPTDYSTGSATGAPPDAFFTAGQNWGFPPLHPITSRARHHEEFKLALRHHLRHTGLLRIDHLMSLERLWWVPSGRSARDGVYVRHPTNELMAIVAIEADRAQSVIVGENLGTVTDEINATMEKWAMLGMYEMQFEAWRAHEEGRIEPPAQLTVAGLNTHDMPTLAGWWEGHDIIDAVELGLVDGDDAPQLIAERRTQLDAFAAVLGRDLGAEVAAEPGEVLRASLEWLGQSPAQVVLATLEDLWLEERPQNVPGTSHERPNWRRRFARPIDEALTEPDLVATLMALQRARARLGQEEL